MYLLGGRAGPYHLLHSTASVLKLGIVQGIWNESEPMPEPRYDCLAYVVESNVYVFGGNVCVFE
jgi:hypothetical protein